MQQESLYVFILIISCVSCLLCNVALKRQTTHSSMYIHHESTINGASCNTVDGLEDTDFFNGSCFHSSDDDDNPPWMQIDLGSDYNITYVNFSLREDHPDHGHFKELRKIEIQVSGAITANGSLVDPKTCAKYMDTPQLTDIGTQIKVNCDTVQTGRYIKVKKLISPEPLQFCEIRVFVDIPEISKCPLPPVSWICLDLCYDAVNQSDTCPPESTSTSSITDTRPQENTLTTGNTVTMRPQETTTITGNTDTRPQETTTITGNIDTRPPETTTITGNTDTRPPETTTITGNIDTTQQETTTPLCKCSCTTDRTDSESEDYISSLIDEIKIDKQETTIAKSKRSSPGDTRTSAQAIGAVGIIIIVFPCLLFIVLDIATIINKKTRRSKQNK